MSNITDIIIVDSSDNTETFKDIKKFSGIYEGFNISSVCNSEILKLLGGGKVFTGEVYMGSYNKFPLDEFLNFLKHDVRWTFKDEVLVLIKQEAKQIFEITMLGDYKVPVLEK